MAFVSCYSITKVTHKKYNYTKNINFFINKVEEIKTISGTFNSNDKWQTKPTDKFVLIDITVINKSNKIKKFDLKAYYYIIIEQILNIKLNGYY